MTRTILASALVLVVTSTAHAQAVPPRVQQIVELLAMKHPDLAAGGDDQRRELTHQIIEQIVFELPGDGWGWKSADATRPPSKDAIARQVGASLLGCDWQNGSTRQPNRPVTCADITGQHFIAVAGVDHLGSSPAPVPPSTPPPAPVFDDSRLFSAIQGARDALYQQAERIKENATNEHGELAKALARVEAAANEPAWWKKIIGNKYVQMGLAAATVFLEERIRQ